MMNDPDDLIVWPDDCWCLRRDLYEYSWRGDDYEQFAFGTEAWRTTYARLTGEAE